MVRYLKTQICTTCIVPCIKTNTFSYTYTDEEERIEATFNTCKPTLVDVGYAKAKRMMKESLDELRNVKTF